MSKFTPIEMITRAIIAVLFIVVMPLVFLFFLKQMIFIPPFFLIIGLLVLMFIGTVGYCGVVGDL